MRRIRFSSNIWQSNDRKSNNGSAVFDLKPYCCSSENNYIPVFAFKNGTFISNGTKQEVIYNPFLVTNIPEKTIGDKELTEVLVELMSGSNLSYDRILNKYCISKHLLFSVDQRLRSSILFYTVVPKDYFFEYSRRMIHSRSYYYDDNFDYSKLIFVLTSDIDVPLHTPIRKRILNLIKKKYPKNDIIITSNLDKWGFNESTPVPHFESVMESIEYYESIKSSLL